MNMLKNTGNYFLTTHGIPQRKLEKYLTMKKDLQQQK